MLAVPARSRERSHSEPQERTLGISETKNAGPREGKDWRTATQRCRSQTARESGFRAVPRPTTTSHLPRGPGRLTHLVPRRGAGLSALTWRCGRPTPASRLSSPLPVAPGAAFPIGLVTPGPELWLPRGAGRAGAAAAAARWGRSQVRPARRAASPPPGLWRHLPAGREGTSPPLRVPASS